MSEPARLVRIDNAPWRPVDHWVIEGLIEPGVRGFVWAGDAPTPEEAVAAAKLGFGERFFPLKIAPNYVATGQIHPIYVETRRRHGPRLDPVRSGTDREAAIRSGPMHSPLTCQGDAA